MYDAAFLICRQLLIIAALLTWTGEIRHNQAYPLDPKFSLAIKDLRGVGGVSANSDPSLPLPMHVILIYVKGTLCAI